MDTKNCEPDDSGFCLPTYEEMMHEGALVARDRIARHFEAQAEKALGGKLVGRFARAEELRAVAAEIREVEV